MTDLTFREESSATEVERATHAAADEFRRRLPFAHPKKTTYPVHDDGDPSAGLPCTD